jgi:hypothetical protein
MKVVLKLGVIISGDTFFDCLVNNRYEFKHIVKPKNYEVFDF